MHGQKGLTLISLLFMLMLAVTAAMVAFKVVPAYIQYYTVRDTLRNILASDVHQTNQAIRESFSKRLLVNYVDGITERDLIIEQDNNQIILTVPISRKEHFIDGVSICVDLEATASAPLR